MDKTAQLEQVILELTANRVTAELAKTANQVVPGAGNSNATVMFIGEAPGATEDKVGTPFMGSAGKFLDHMLETIGLKRSDVYITNIVKYRPPKNRDPSPKEISESLTYLDRELRIINPKLIVFLGRHSMNAFYPDLKIGDMHGREIRDGDRVYLPLYHPAAALYNPGIRNTLLEDFKKVSAIINENNK
jgi:DNA polymerase